MDLKFEASKYPKIFVETMDATTPYIEINDITVRNSNLIGIHHTFELIYDGLGRIASSSGLPVITAHQKPSDHIEPVIKSDNWKVDTFHENWYYVFEDDLYTLYIHTEGLPFTSFKNCKLDLGDITNDIIHVITPNNIRITIDPDTIKSLPDPTDIRVLKMKDHTKENQPYFNHAISLPFSCNSNWNPKLKAGEFYIAHHTDGKKTIIFVSKITDSRIYFNESYKVETVDGRYEERMDDLHLTQKQFVTDHDFYEHGIDWLQPIDMNDRRI